MPIYRLLKDAAFDSTIVEAAGQAYEDLLVDLQLADRNDPFTAIIAKHVMQVARTGVSSSPEIRKKVLAALAKPS